MKETADEKRTNGVVAEIHMERARQKTCEDWTPEHDDEHDLEELALAAACYAVGRPIRLVLSSGGRELWPWAKRWDKRSQHPRRRQLVIAAALIVAEIERLDRAAEFQAAVG